ncbi:hypothetical protein KTT60_22460 [Pseudomonas viridiflava]|nr:hypothetical protein [Pseudomonas viridiflava]
MYRISVDTGGTFTDVVVTDDKGRLYIGNSTYSVHVQSEGAGRKA